MSMAQGNENSVDAPQDDGASTALGCRVRWKRATAGNEDPPRPYRQTGARSHGVGFAVVQVDRTSATLKPVIRHAQNGAEDQVAHETRQGLPRQR